jgi:hypothetical protein
VGTAGLGFVVGGFLFCETAIEDNMRTAMRTCFTLATPHRMADESSIIPALFLDG